MRPALALLLCLPSPALAADVQTPLQALSATLAAIPADAARTDDRAMIALRHAELERDLTTRARAEWGLMIRAVVPSARTLRPGSLLRVRVRTNHPAQVTVMLVRGPDTKAAVASTSAPATMSELALRVPRILASGRWRLRVSARSGDIFAPSWSAPLRAVRG